MGNLTSGYTMIDCTGIELTTETKQTIPGIYNQVVSALKAGKFVIACGLTFGGEICTPAPVMINNEPGGDDIVCTSSTLQVWVDADNGVLVVNMAPANRAKTTKSTK